MTLIDVSVLVAILSLAGIIVQTIAVQRERKANADNITGKTYRDLLEGIKLDNDRLEAEKKNLEALLLKRQLDFDDRVGVERNKRKSAEHERDAYINYASALRRLALRHVPKEISLPEVDMNGTTPNV